MCCWSPKRSCRRLGALVGSDPRILATASGRALEGARARHPWIARDVPIVLGEHVTLETGTGLVHTAPGHGHDDYEVGRRYGLDTYAPVDDSGRFLPTVEKFGGQNVFAADPLIIEHLRAAGRLLATEPLTHSYPHCWRCKRPVIFRATEQWFVSMQDNDLRGKALDAIDHVRWIPAWGHDRITGMVSTRPDWCISRQRAWGVPIVALRCESCSTVGTSAELLTHVADVFARETADAWFVHPAADLTPPGFSCQNCGGKTFRKEEDILDVWFDSGVSFAAVVERRPELGGHADLYFEGSDQHRGWFQSALLTSVATRARAPYETVLTHGFFLDEDARKMSKSKGNVVVPQKIVAAHGADILRLWVAAADYRDDMRISQEILERAVEAYRRIRNTARFLLGNLADFDPVRDRVPAPRPSRARPFRARSSPGLHRAVPACLRGVRVPHRLPRAQQLLRRRSLGPLSRHGQRPALLRRHDRAVARRSAQTALYHVLDALVRVMAPILSFTAEEIWSCMPADPSRPASVHLTDFPRADPALRDAELARAWDQLLEVRGAVTKTLEDLRKRGEIGHSLEASVQLAAAGALADVLTARRALLPEIFIVSRVELVAAGAIPATTAGLGVAARRIEGAKCARCWNYRPDVGDRREFPALCGRCAAVVAAGDVPAASS